MPFACRQVFAGFSAAIQHIIASDICLNDCKWLINATHNGGLKSSAANQITDCNQSFNTIEYQLESVRKQARSMQVWMDPDPLRYGLSNNYVNVSDILLKSFL